MISLLLNKKNGIPFLAIIYFLVGCSQSKHLSEINNRSHHFDSDWRFTRDSVNGAESPEFDDSKWRLLDLPHDWSIEDLPQQVQGKTIGPFSKESPGGMSTGYTIGGTGWYRKMFTLDEGEQNKLVSVYFEGSYMETDVWINGNHLGMHPYGYTSFSYDITKFCKPSGQKNTLAVRVINKGKNSRWYSGSGIYRHVWLIVTNPLHFDQWGIYITTPEVSHQSAKVNIVTTILNESSNNENIKLRIRLLNAKNKPAGESEASHSIGSNGKVISSQSIIVNSPNLWSPDSPYLYTTKVELLVNGKLKDVIVKSFGIRTITINAEDGFVLNGNKMELRGGCIHHDNGILGAAAIDCAEERRVELLKSSGFNAIRCSHNPPSEKFLESCDRLGMMVIDEAFDMWQRPKNPDDYHRFFDQWWERDIESMIMRDRNHPSVILWSMGNEINERADTSGLEITKKIRAKIKELDLTRLVTEAICEFWDHPGRPWEATAPAFALLDVDGYNYQWWNYEPDHDKFPQRIMMGTESVPIHAFENWQQVEKHPWVIGDFVWTAMDYLGESGIGHVSCENKKDYQLEDWPWFNAYCGDIDLIGNKKPQSYFRDVVWRRSKIEMAVHTPLPEGCKEKVSYWGWRDEQQSWSWPGHEGKKLEVSVYSRYPVVRLELNGKLIGEKKISDSSNLTARFEVPYEAGELKAIGIENEKSSSVTLTTVNAPARFRLIADRSIIKASRNDLSYITVEIVDDKNRLVPDANIPVQFSISGNGELAAVGNGNPADMDSFKQPVRNTFKGRCLVILRPKGIAGDIILQAKSEGLESGELKVRTE